MEKVLAVIATAAVGGLIALQPPVNAQLGKATSVLGAAFISTAISALVMGVLFFAAGKGGELARVPDVRPIYLIGGLLGAVLVTVSLVTVDTLGAGGVVAATVSAQLIVSALLDRARCSGPRGDRALAVAGDRLRAAAGGYGSRHRRALT